MGWPMGRLGAWWRRRRANRAVEIRCRMFLPLAIVLVLILAVAPGLAIVVVLRTGLVLRLAVLRTRLVVATMALITTLMPFLAVLPAITAMVLRLIGHRLRSDTDTQQTNTGQTPDARFHAFPHCGLGPVHKTGKARAGSARGYQSRNLFIEG